MRNVFVLSFLANLMLTLAALAVLPSPVASHFDASGLADGWASKPGYALLTAGTSTLLFMCITLAPRLVRVTPVRWVNLPHREYWLSPEHREETLVRMAELMWPLGTALFVFLFVAGVLTIQANFTQPPKLNMAVFFAALALFAGYMVYWLVGFYRAFRLPVKP